MCLKSEFKLTWIALHVSEVAGESKHRWPRFVLLALPPGVVEPHRRVYHLVGLSCRIPGPSGVARWDMGATGGGRSLKTHITLYRGLL